MSDFFAGIFVIFIIVLCGFCGFLGLMDGDYIVTLVSVYVVVSILKETV